MPPCINATISIRHLQHNFPKMRGGESKAVWNFKDSSDLVAGFFPKQTCCSIRFSSRGPLVCSLTFLHFSSAHPVSVVDILWWICLLRIKTCNKFLTATTEYVVIIEGSTTHWHPLSQAFPGDIRALSSFFLTTLSLSSFVLLDHWCVIYVSIQGLKILSRRSSFLRRVSWVCGQMIRRC